MFCIVVLYSSYAWLMSVEAERASSGLSTVRVFVSFFFPPNKPNPWNLSQIGKRHFFFFASSQQSVRLIHTSHAYIKFSFIHFSHHPSSHPTFTENTINVPKHVVLQFLQNVVLRLTASIDSTGFKNGCLITNHACMKKNPCQEMSILHVICQNVIIISNLALISLTIPSSQMSMKITLFL